MGRRQRARAKRRAKKQERGIEPTQNNPTSLSNARRKSRRVQAANLRKEAYWRQKTAEEEARRYAEREAQLEGYRRRQAEQKTMREAEEARLRNMRSTQDTSSELQPDMQGKPDGYTKDGWPVEMKTAPPLSIDEMKGCEHGKVHRPVVRPTRPRRRSMMAMLPLLALAAVGGEPQDME